MPTTSMFELKIPTPIRTLGATVTVEGELPGFRHGVVYPNWDANVSGSYWGGTGTLEGPPWEPGPSYFVDSVVEKGGLVFLANDPIAAGEDPFLGDQRGGNDQLTVGGGVTPYGGRQSFRTSTAVTCTGCELWGYDVAGGFGMRNGMRVGLSDGSTHPGGGQSYDDFVYLTQGSYQGPTVEGFGHIQFDHPVKLNAMTDYWLIHDGDNSVTPSAVRGNFYFTPGMTYQYPVYDVGDWFTGLGYGGNLGGGNANSRLMFKLWTTPWDLRGAGISATPRDPRFKIYIGPSGMDFDAISEDMMSEVSLVDPTYVGPSSFGGTGPGITRHCFQVKDIIAATPANLQSLYIKYAPTNIPADAPNGVAVYNITAEAYVPGYQLGPHSTSARFY